MSKTEWFFAVLEQVGPSEFVVCCHTAFNYPEAARAVADALASTGRRTVWSEVDRNGTPVPGVAGRGRRPPRAAA